MRGCPVKIHVYVNGAKGPECSPALWFVANCCETPPSETSVVRSRHGDSEEYS